MSLLPYYFDDFCCGPRRCTRKDQYWDPIELFLNGNLANNLRSRLDKNTSIQIDKHHFQANIDVQQFKPEEISVKLTDGNTVTVEGKHEEKQDEHGFVSRHFVRKYVLPKDCDAQNVQSKLSSDGVLSIVAPKKPKEKQITYKEVPVVTACQILKNVEQTKKIGQGDAPTAKDEPKAKDAPKAKDVPKAKDASKSK